MKINKKVVTHYETVVVPASVKTQAVNVPYYTMTLTHKKAALLAAILAKVSGYDGKGGGTDELMEISTALGAAGVSYREWTNAFEDRAFRMILPNNNPEVLLA
jgi:hypothetical protein